MSLGRFGSRSAKLKAPSIGGSAPQRDFIETARDLRLPSDDGTPAISSQTDVGVRSLSHDLVFSATDNDTVAWASGTITLSDGTAYSINAGNTGNISALTYIYLDVDTSTTVLQTTTTAATATGDRKHLIAIAQNVADATKFAFYQVFGGAGGFGGTYITAAMIGSLVITAAEIANATITSGKTVVGLRNLSYNLVFSATDNNTVAWTSGTITLSDGTAYSINSGNTGNIAALTYIYLDTSASTTVLQTTTTAATATGDTKHLIAIAENVADAAKFCKFQVFGGDGGIGGTFITANMIGSAVITANEIAAATITATEIANLTITAAKISSLTITAGEIASNAITTAKILADAVTLRYNDSATNIDLNASMTDLVSRTYTPAVACDVLVIAGATFQEKTSVIAGEGQLQLVYDGSAITGSFKAFWLPLTAVNTNWTSIAVVAIQTGVTSASHTFKLQGLAPVSGAAKWQAINCGQALLELKR